MITEILFGKRQANIGSAILQNYERAQEILETSRNSAGSAEAENAKYLESVQGHLDQFQAKWEALSVSLMNSTGLKVLIDLGGQAINVLDGLTNVFGSVNMALLPLLGAASKLGNIGLFQTVDKYDKATGEISQATAWHGPAIGNLGNIKQIKTQYEKDIFASRLERDENALNDFNDMIKDGNVTVSEAVSKMGTASDAARDYAMQTREGAADVEEFKKRQIKANDALQKSQKGFKGFSSSAKALIGNLGIDLAIGAAIAAGQKLWDYLDETFTFTDESKLNAMEETISDFETKTKEATDNKSDIKSMASEFTELAKGVNDAGENVGLSADQFNRYNELVSELTGIAPELITGYTSEGNAIVNRNTAIQDGIKLQEEYAAAATKAYTTTSAMDSIIEGASVGMSEAESNIHRVASIDLKNSLLDSKKSYSSSRVGGPKESATSELLNEALEHQVDLEKLTNEEVGEIVAKRQKITDLAKESGNYSKDELESLNSSLTDISEYYSQLKEEAQPIYENLLAFVGKVDEETGMSIMDSIPENLQDAFQTGLQDLSLKDLSASEMKAQARQLSDDLKNLYQTNVDYKDALNEVTEAKEEFNDSNRNESDVKKYNKSVKSSVEALNELADAQEEAGNNTLANVLRQQALDLEDYAQSVSESLETAFNPYQDKFDEGKNAKDTFDEWREGITDYADGISSYKEILDEVLTSTETGGNGSMAFWEAAESTLGEKTVRELNYNVDAAKSKMKELQSAMTDGSSATDYFYRSLGDNADEINKILGKKAIKETAEGISFDIDSSEWAAVADVLGVSEETMMSLLNAARQFSNIDLSNTNAVREALKGQDTTIQKDGKMFALAEPIEQEAQKALGSVEQAHKRIKELNEEDDINLISLDVLKDNVNYSKDYLESQTSIFKKYQKQAKSVAGSFVQLGIGSKADGGFSFSSEDIEKVTASLFEMGGTADDVYATLKGFRDSSGIKLSDELSKKNDKGLKEWAMDRYEEYQEALTEDPTLKLANSTDTLTRSIERLIAAMGGIPDIDIDSNLDEIKDDIDKTDWGKLSEKEASEKSSEIQSKIDSSQKDVDAYQTAYDKMSESEKNSDRGKKLAKEIEEYKAEIDKLQEKLDGKTVEVDVKVKNEKALEKLKEDLDVDSDEEITVRLKTLQEDEGYEEFINKLNLTPKEEKVLLKAVDAGASGDIDTFIKNFRKLPEEVQTQLITTIENPDDISDYISKINGVDERVTTTATVNYTRGDQDAPLPGESFLKYLFGGQAPAKNDTANVNYTKGKQTPPEDKEATLTYRIRASFAGLSEKVKNLITGNGASGTDNRRVFNSAAKGKVGPSGNGGLTLTGELGPELVWLPRQSKSFITGMFGPEMQYLPHDAVVYPANETRRIMGDTMSLPRPKFGSMAEGAYDPIVSSPKSSTSPKSSKSSSKSTKKKGKTTRKKGKSLSVKGFENKQEYIDSLLERGLITEVGYYERLQKYYKKAKKKLEKSTEDYRKALEALRQARIDAYEHEKDTLESLMNRGELTEAQYYKKLLKLGKKYYTKNGKIRKGYTDEWRQWQEDLIKAKEDAYNAEADKLNRKLEYETITYDTYLKKMKKLRKKYLTGDGLKDQRQDALDEELDSLEEHWEDVLDDVQETADDKDLFAAWGENEDKVKLLQQALKKLKKSKDTFFNYGKAGENKYYSLVLNYEREIKEAQDDRLDDQKDKLDEILDMVEDLVRQEAEDYIDALEDAVDAYSEIIDKKKEALQLAEDEAEYQESMTDYAQQMAKLQQEISVLSRDDSRAGKAKLLEKQEELAELQKEMNSEIRDETLDRTEDALDEQANKFEELVQKEIDVINEFLDNQRQVLDEVEKQIQNADQNDLFNRLIEWNNKYGDGFSSTVDEFWADLQGLLGDNIGKDISEIVEILKKYQGNTGGTIPNAKTGTHHTGLASGFVGDGASLKQHEVYSLLTDDELILNKEDQFRLASQLTVGDTMQKAYGNLVKSLSPDILANPSNIELTVTAPVTIQGNADSKTVAELNKFGDRIADSALDKLSNALRINGVTTSATANVRKK